MTKPCIIIPALNEEKSLGAIIKSSLIYGDVLVVNDASDDNTLKVSLKGGATVINNRVNLGYDKSLLKV